VLLRQDGEPDRRPQTAIETLRRWRSRQAELKAQHADDQSNDQGQSQYDGYSPSSLPNDNGESGIDMGDEDMDSNDE